MPAALFVSLFIVLVGAIVVLVIVANRKRTQELAEVAQALKLEFYPKGSDRLKPLLANLDFFSKARYARIANLMMGKSTLDGKTLSIAIFDYSFTVGRTVAVGRDTNSETFSHSVLLFFASDLDLPAFTLRPEHFLDKLGNALGYIDINFSAHPKFSKKYRLSGQQESRVRSLFQPAVLQFLERENLCVEGSGTYLMLYPVGDHNPHKRSVHVRDGKTYTESRFLSAAEIPTFVETGKKLFRLLHS